MNLHVPTHLHLDPGAGFENKIVADLRERITRGHTGPQQTVLIASGLRTFPVQPSLDGVSSSARRRIKRRR